MNEIAAPSWHGNFTGKNEENYASETSRLFNKKL
jgi:hypothetical protein